MHVGDAGAQARFLREVGRLSPQIVMQRVESGRFASNETVLKEYIKALVVSGRLDQANLGDVVRAYSADVSPGSALLAQQVQQQLLQQQQQQLQMQQQMQLPLFSAGVQQQQQQQLQQLQQQQHSQQGASGGWGAGLGWGPGAALGRSGAALGALPSSEASPVFVQMVDGSVKAQMWRTFRALAVGALMLGGISMFIDSKGMPRGLGLSNEVKPVMEESGKTFKDVMGASEAKEELQEIVAYLKDPSKFTRLGGKLPKGVLLTGPPGTGKTLLAKAIAGEAGTPFFYASGSEFEEMYVGVGARRVRDLFEAAKKAAPCIVFIDEIDAIGSTRALKEQQALKMTLNQLLVELDGFKETEGVIIVGATNFPELLDPALVRPGRFDRNVVVPLPDLNDRVQILRLYLDKVPCASDVDAEQLARGTPGASGADLANLVNIAALRASTSGAELVGLADLEFAKDKIQTGSERKSAIIPQVVRNQTAYHEGGHALVAIHTKGAMPVHKASIMPRGMALGMVHQLPEESDMLQRTRRQMLAELDVCMGGRVAEEIMFGADEVTSGASSDIQKATQIARGMVERYGMGADAAVGVMFAPGEGRDRQNLSDETRKRVDDEVRKMLAESYSRAKALLTAHKHELHRLAQALLEYESLTRDQIELVIQGKPLPKADKLKPAPKPNNNSKADKAQQQHPIPHGKPNVVPKAQPTS